MREPIPTQDPALPRRVADFDTLPDALDYAAKGIRGLNFYSPRGELESSITYAQIRDRAMEIGRRLIHFGMQKGDRVALIAETSEDFVCYFMGCQYAGMLPVPLPLPTSFGGRDGYTRQLHQQMSSCGAQMAFSASYMLPLLDEATEGLKMRFVGTADTFEAQTDLNSLEAVELPKLLPEDLAYLQYSSGSTRFPHGVAVTHRSLMANCHGISAEGVEVNDNDRVVSWLPFYHDMGLVGTLLSPISCQMTTDYLATEAFARRPMQWLKLISRNKGTITYSPTFGYEICTRRANGKDTEGLDLSSWRVAGIGGDMIRADVLRSFHETFNSHGFRDTSFLPSYGLAECTLAVSFMKLDTGVQIDMVNEKVLTGEIKTLERLDKSQLNGHAANYREVVNCGRPLNQYELEVRDENDNDLGEREIGRICVRGPSVMVGYFDDEEATRACLSEDGWLDTGDMGYVADGSIYIIGRIKDLIIINGKNHWPQDIEWAVEQIADLRSGDSAAISIPGDNNEEIPAILVQCRTRDEAGRMELEDRIKSKVKEMVGASARVVLLPPRSLPRTSSGKLSRSKARQQYLAGKLAS